MPPLRLEVVPGRPAAGNKARRAASECVPNGPHRTPATAANLWARCRNSVWLPVAARASGVALLMLGLAGIGAVSILSGAGGVPASAAATTPAASSGSWLAPANSAARSPAARGAVVARERFHGVAAPRAHASSTSARGQGPQPLSTAGQQQGEMHSAGITPDGKIILNIAAADELTRLPGVGVKRAASIIRLRERLKRFRRLTDLLRVRGIGTRRFRQMLPHLVLDPPRKEKGEEEKTD